MCLNCVCLKLREQERGKVQALYVVSVSKWCWFNSHVTEATLTFGFHATDPTSNLEISKLPLNYLIDQLEKPTSIWARRGNRVDRLWEKQGGVACYMSMLSLSLQKIFNYKRLVMHLHPPSILHLHPDKRRPLPLGLTREICRHLISCLFFLTTNPLWRYFFYRHLTYCIAICVALWTLFLSLTDPRR